MSNTIILKKSAVTGNAPASGDLSLGEIAINYADGHLYYKSGASATPAKINAGDADTVDGLHASSFLRSDASDTFSAGNTLTIAGVARSTNNANVDGPNFNVSTTNKSTAEYAYRVDRSGTTVGGIKIDGTGLFADGLTVGTGTVSTSKIGQWDTAYGWGDHSTAGYSSSSAFLPLTGGDLTGPLSISNSSGNTLTLKKGTGTPSIALAGTSSEASALIEGISGGGLTLYTSNGGTLSSPSWSPKMTVLAGGRVGIGTTTPDASTLLHVQGVIGTTNGSAAAPTHSFYGDPDNGMFRAAVNTLGFSTAGTERMRINSSGNVGIGITPPTANVHKQLFIGTTAYLLGSTGGALDLGVNLYYNSGWKYRTTNAASLLDFTATGKMVLYTAPSGTANSAATITPRFTVDNTGNVGIGTTSPAKLLDVSSASNPTIRISSSKSGSFSAHEVMSSLEFYSADTSGVGAGVRSSIRSLAHDQYGSRTELSFSTTDSSGDSEKMRIDTNGNVGIGTTSPISITSGVGSLTLNGTNSTVGGGIVYQVNGSTKAYHYVESNLLRHQAAAGVGQQFYTNGSESMRIQSDGNVGIGTTSPSYKLTVDDNSVTNIPKTLLQFDASSIADNGGYNIDFRTSSNDLANRYVARIRGIRESSGALSQLSFWTESGSALEQRMTIRASGNVGIGTTSPSYKLQVRSADANDDVAYIHHDNPSQTSGTVLKVRSDAGNHSGYSLLDVQNNSVNALYVRGDGKVGIGTTSPTNILHTYTSSNTVGRFESTDSDAHIRINDNADSLYVGTQNQKGYIGSTAANSSNNLTIDLTNGNVGIGTTSPSTKLHVYEAVNRTTAIVQNNDHTAKFEAYGNATAIDTTASNGLFIRYNGSNRVHFEAGGNVGIGTDSPSQKLDVVGHVEANTTNANFRAIDGTIITKLQSQTAGATQGVIGTESNNNLAIVTSNQTRMFVNTSGNVGIGTTSPTTKLAIQSGISASSADVITLLQETNGAEKAAATIGISIGNNGESTNASDLWFATATGGSTSEKMRITSAGNVGIGTTSPSAKLHVDDNAASGTGLRVTGGGGGGPLATFTRDVGSTGTIAISSSGGDPQITFATSANTFALGTNGSTFEICDNSSVGANTRLSITSAGNVGIGTTNPSSLLHLESASSPALQIKDTTQGTTLKAFSQDSNAHLGTFSSHPLVFDTNSSERMRITAAGNVGIGTTTPSAKLEVNGHFAATTKSFIIDNPKTDGRLQYGVVETDEHSVYVRGKSDQEEIQLPEEWEWLVHEDSVTALVTAVGQTQRLFVIEETNKKITVGGLADGGRYNYVVYGTRKDVDALEKHLK